MLAILREGKNIFFRHLNVKIHGLKQYSGNDEEICHAIINECYNSKKEHFMTSNGNYKVFYARDFGWCIQSLINLDYKTQVNNTLEYAMKAYYTHNRITVAINNHDKPFNFPDIYSPDSVAYMYRSLRIAKSKKLILEYKEFLNSELKKFELKVLNSDGTLKDDSFSGMRDHVKVKRSCYDIIMACMLCDEVNKINKLFGKEIIINILEKYHLKEKLIGLYWNKTYFIDSISDNYCSGHANTYPYYLDIITDKTMLKASIKTIKQNKLDSPIPLKYGYSNDTKFIWVDMFSHDWEKHTSWAMLGMAYIEVISKVDRKEAKKYLSTYYQMIIKHKCFLEVYTEEKPYQSLFFTSDDSMLWASMYLDLKKKLKN